MEKDKVEEANDMIKMPLKITRSGFFVGLKDSEDEESVKESVDDEENDDEFEVLEIENNKFHNKKKQSE